MKNKKRILWSIAAAIVILIAGMFVYQVHINYRFRVVDEGKVYRSGVIPPAQIKDYVQKYGIRSIIDLRMPGTANLVDNPEIEDEVLKEKHAVEALEGINYYNLGSDQVPTQANLEQFYQIMDNQANYPVLIHCYHGVGRAGIYSAIYQIEYQGLSPEEARLNTRSLVELRPLIFSSFDDGKPKGEFLKNYKRRAETK